MNLLKTFFAAAAVLAFPAFADTFAYSPLGHNVVSDYESEMSWYVPGGSDNPDTKDVNESTPARKTCDVSRPWECESVEADARERVRALVERVQAADSPKLLAWLDGWLAEQAERNRHMREDVPHRNGIGSDGWRVFEASLNRVMRETDMRDFLNWLD